MCLVVGVMMPAALADDSNETFIVVTNEDPKSFNPDAQADDYGWPIFQNIFDGLFQLNWNNEIVPNLCETYTISDDGLTYTFNAQGREMARRRALYFRRRGVHLPDDHGQQRRHRPGA